MKKIKILPITLIAVAALVITSVAYASPAAATQDFGARLVGGEEVPPRDTDATGTAFFQLNADGTALSYTVSVANIENVFASHIHCGAKGANGPIGVTLFMGPVGGGPISGTLAKGTITAPDPGNGCGWTDLAAVVTAMNSGNTYVNVHTNDGVAPTNTGPGDFPGGEIRGQIAKTLPAKVK
jgi:CHRD domain-containing protein